MIRGGVIRSAVLRSSMTMSGVIRGAVAENIEDIAIGFHGASLLPLGGRCTAGQDLRVATATAGADAGTDGPERWAGIRPARMSSCHSSWCSLAQPSLT